MAKKSAQKSPPKKQSKRKRSNKKPLPKFDPPKTIKNATLGTLRLTAVLTDNVEYSVQHELGGERVDLVLYSADGSQEMETTIAVACQLVKSFPKVQSRIKKYLTQTLVKKVNTHLRPKGDPLRPADLWEQLALELIYLHPTGNATFWYAALEVLLHHSLALYGTADGTITDFDTPG